MTGIAISNQVTIVGETTVKTVTVVSIEVKSSDAHLMMVGVEVKIVTAKLTSAESPRARGLESQNQPANGAKDHAPTTEKAPEGARTEEESITFGGTQLVKEADDQRTLRLGTSATSRSAALIYFANRTRQKRRRQRSETA
jgi:hypothetical protein